MSGATEIQVLWSDPSDWIYVNNALTPGEIRKIDEEGPLPEGWLKKVLVDSDARVTVLRVHHGDERIEGGDRHEKVLRAAEGLVTGLLPLRGLVRLHPETAQSLGRFQEPN